MSSGTIVISVSSHPWRCIDEDGTRCPWIRTYRFGTRWTCKLFHEYTLRGHEQLEERDGCLVRCDECLRRSGPNG